MIPNNITLNSIQHRLAQGASAGKVDEPTVRRLWWGALETLQEDILGPMNLKGGLWLASPLPALYKPSLLEALEGWVWAPDELINLQVPSIGLLPPGHLHPMHKQIDAPSSSYNRLPLKEEDGKEPLLLIITPEIQLALALYGEAGKRSLIMRSDPQTFQDVLKMLDLRLNNEDPKQAKKLRKSLADLGQLESHESIDKFFWPLLSSRLAAMPSYVNLKTFSLIKTQENPDKDSCDELSLLEALTHEIRTPLATIRTLIRSLLKQNDLSELVVNRLRQIDGECTEQIDRFGLIFNAAELQRQEPEVARLAGTDLGNMLKILQSGWTKQLERKGIELALDITPDLPEVLSDPARLETMLGGLIDRNTRGLKPGSKLCLELRPAGQRLKLQIISQTTINQDSYQSNNSNNADLGPVLSWDPKTGSLQLSQKATQRLLASLGGRLTRRKNVGMTIFFPIVES